MSSRWISRINAIILSAIFLAVLFNLFEPGKHLVLLTIFLSIIYMLDDNKKEQSNELE